MAVDVEASPEDPESRDRGYADAEARGSGHSPDVLASWALAAIDALDADEDRSSYFSMAGGHGTVGLWGRHVAAELSIHRIDVEQALGAPIAMSNEMAVDAIEYTAEWFLPAMARATDTDPGALAISSGPEGANTATLRAAANDQQPLAQISGAPVDVLAALWNRPHGDITIDGDRDVFDTWCSQPGRAFQFGTWD